ncbi:c-type cytochrome [Acaryochloris marina]|uniref:Cytochrome c, CytM n=1 Tax=Acaryochloris marina (strain MBIC 11017) TaxID=329726 RepID=B0CC81_ACAM1|nr:cytochrome c [Acaryochloris marina]ABW26766.1 cytochrome c, CytM [Acaryochloris marina MBIC11017]BDM81543.1 cytochrome [Acaryochloris marina MBIC10699]
MEDPALKSDQTLNPGLSIQKALLVVLGWLLVIAVIIGVVYQARLSDPYVQDVLHHEGTVAQGNAIFQLNCSGCHGTSGDGKVGPSLRRVTTHRSQVGLIYQITSGKTPPMPKFQANPQEMADLLEYLKTL